MVWRRQKVLLPVLAVIGMAMVGFMWMARRDGVPRPTQLRAHQQTLSESPSFEPEVNESAEAGGNGISEMSEEPTEADQALVVGGEGPLNIKYISLIAERHSGSTWMVQFLQGYFKGKDVKVTATLCTWKHWFQDRIHEDIQDGKRICCNKQPCPSCHDIGHTLVIAMWRNPYDWMSGMNRLPHHAKAHFNMDLPGFMQKRWMLDAQNEQKARIDALMKVKNEAPCLDSFLPWEVVPCRENDRSAIYELDENGEAYDNLYALRKAKIRDFNAVEAWAPYYEKILYEDILTGTGLKDWLTLLEKRYGLSGKKDAVPSASLVQEMAASRAGMYYFNSQTCAPRCTMGGKEGQDAVKILHSMWDEKLEGGLGYHKVGAPHKRGV